MAAEEETAATKINRIAKCKNDEINNVIPTVIPDEDARQAFIEQLDNIDNRLQGLHLDDFQVKIMDKIRQKLDEYEAKRQKSERERVARQISKLYKMEYGKMSAGELRSAHEQIRDDVHREKPTKLTLMINYQRGMYYDSLNDKDEGKSEATGGSEDAKDNSTQTDECGGTDVGGADQASGGDNVVGSPKKGKGWKDAFKKEHGVTYATAQQYIRVAKLIEKYPLLIICDLPYTVLLRYRARLLEELEKEKEGLKQRLAFNMTEIED